MSAIAQVPILGHVVETIKLYGEVTLRIFRHPIKAMPDIAKEDAGHLADAVKYLTAAVVIIYLVNVPVFDRWGEKPSQSIFLLFFLLRYAVVFPVLHAVMRLLGSKTQFRASMRLLCFSMGALVPPGVLLQLPYLYYTGPDALFGTLPKTDESELPSAVIPIVLASEVAFFVFNMALLPIQLIWFKRVYDLRWLRTLIGSFGGIGLGFLVFNFLIDPIWNWLKPLLEIVEHYT